MGLLCGLPRISNIVSNITLVVVCWLQLGRALPPSLLLRLNMHIHIDIHTYYIHAHTTSIPTQSSIAHSCMHPKWV